MFPDSRACQFLMSIAGRERADPTVLKGRRPFVWARLPPARRGDASPLVHPACAIDLGL